VSSVRSICHAPADAERTRRRADCWRSGRAANCWIRQIGAILSDDSSLHAHNGERIFVRSGQRSNGANGGRAGARYDDAGECAEFFEHDDGDDSRRQPRWYDDNDTGPCICRCQQFRHLNHLDDGRVRYDDDGRPGNHDVNLSDNIDESAAGLEHDDRAVDHVNDRATEQVHHDDVLPSTDNDTRQAAQALRPGMPFTTFRVKALRTPGGICPMSVWPPRGDCVWERSR
jgi:hypothetical protein